MPPHGDPRPDCDLTPRTFDPGRVSRTAAPLRCDPTAEYGRWPSGACYAEIEYAERFHILGPDRVAWPPNEGAVRGTKLVYCKAERFVAEFGNRIDRIGLTRGFFFGLMEDGNSASYEARAIYYESLYKALRTYRLKPEMFRSWWRICVMETERALGQPGGSLGLIFFDGKGNRLSARQLTRTGALRYVD